MPKSTRQASVVEQALPQEIATELDLSRKFIGMVVERYGYVVGKKLKQTEMTESVKEEAKLAQEAGEAASKAVETLIKTPTPANASAVTSKREDLKTARDKLKIARKPFMEKIAPLTKAIRFCDSIAIPDSLKQMGLELRPRVELSKWCSDALEATKKK